MIGCMLFYALYPLSRYINRRPSVVKSTVVCDGAAVTRMSFKSQKFSPDQQLSQTSCLTEQEEETMSEQYSVRTESTTPDEQPLICVSQKDGEMEAVSKTSEAHYSANCNDSRAEKDSQDIEIEQTHFPHEEPAVEDNVQQTVCFMESLLKMESLEDSGNAAEGITQETEFWDDYNVMLNGVASSNRKQTSPLSVAQTGRDTECGWHFPAGPGLVDEIHCPHWRFPAMSYYPSEEQMRPLDVSWRLWQKSSTEDSETPAPFKKPFMDFTVMSYNILAQDLLEANIELYKHCPREVLEWSYRCSLLLEEIHKWAPDILCLQEVQENHYQTQLYPVLTQMGYNCVYKRRTGNKTDGCATCYRSSRFSEVSVMPIEFFRPQTEILNRHNVGIVSVLRPVVYQDSKIRAKGSLLCVANTHLLFNPRRGDVKLAQLAILLAEINSVVKSWKAKGEHCNVIMCGDFNSLPHKPLYQLITTGELYFEGLPAWKVSGQKDLSNHSNCHRLFAPLWPNSLGISDCCKYITSNEVVASQSAVSASPGGKLLYSHDFLLKLRFCPVSCVRPYDLEFIPGVTDNKPGRTCRNTQLHRFGDTLRHQLDLESIFNHTLPDSGESEVTTLHSEGGATVDYIFYSPKRTSELAGQSDCEGLKLIGCLSLLTEDTLWSMEGLPSHIFPSDHLSIVAQFRLDLNAAAF
nr:protein angel homolog 1-like [Nerophis lumbriciformis]